MKKIVLLSIIPLFFLFQNAQAKKVRALFIGNSYTASNNLPDLISQLALTTSDTLEYIANSGGGQTFQNHSTNTVVLSNIASGGWDYVILQEQSQMPAFPDDQVAMSVYPYARMLDSLVKVSNPCATTVFFMTWGRKYGDASNCAGFPLICTYQGMDSLLQSRYTIMAQDNGAAIAPVAKTWRKLINDHPSIDLYTGDNSHPSDKGSFAAATTFYTVLFGKDPSLTTYDYTLSASDAATIKSVTKVVVYDSMNNWFQYVPNMLAASFDAAIIENEVNFDNSSENADTYLWNFGDGTNSTEMTPTHTYAATGTYTVTLTAFDTTCGRSNMISRTIVILSVSGIDQYIDASSVRLYPNPVSEKVFIQSDITFVTYIVTDMMGRRVMSNHSMWNSIQEGYINVAKLPAGNYIIQLMDKDHHQIAIKIVKQ